MKRFISLALVCTLLFALIPSTAFAADPIYFEEIEPNNSLKNADSVGNGYIVYGELVTDDDVDCFEFVLTENSDFVFTALSEYQEVSFVFMDANGDPLFWDYTYTDDPENYYYSLALEAFLKPGKYYIAVQMYDYSYSTESYVFSLEFAAHTNHQWTLSGTADFGCGIPGEAYYSCEYCGATYTEYLPATDHNYTDRVIPPSCTSQGYTVRSCQKCGDGYSHSFVEPDKTAHTYSSGDDMTCDACGETRDSLPDTVPMHRLYNPYSGEHFYTGSIAERDNLVTAGWLYEGVAWNAPTASGDPVYRLFNPNTGDHHYTMSAEERDMLVSVGWIYEGVAWNSADSDNLPLYRLYNPNAFCGSHHYTGSEEERDHLVSLGWIYEGIGWYGLVN